MEKYLDHRKIIKSKKPIFSRQDSHKTKRIGTKWRRSKGLQSKMRLQRKGYRRSPSQGYRSPITIRGTDPKGRTELLVHNISDLDKTDKNSIIVISSTVGDKKKVEIIQEGLKRKLIFALKSPDKFVEEILKKRESSSKEKEAKKEKLKEKKQKEAKVTEKKEKTKEEVKDEVAEKKEKDKVLTKKQ